MPNAPTPEEEFLSKSQIMVFFLKLSCLRAIWVEGRASESTYMFQNFYA